MGAAAFGNMDRLTNPYYSQLREIFSLQAAGTGSSQPVVGQLVPQPHAKALFGGLDPYPRRADPARKLWNPDAVLRVEDIRHDK